jgi:hypothetical protein
MAVDRHLRNLDWLLTDEGGRHYNSEAPTHALLMDIRAELRAIRTALFPLRHLDCNNFLLMPHTLKRIADNTTKPRRKKAKR